MGNFLRRHHTAVILPALAVLVPLAGIVTTNWQAHVARRERLRAEEVSAIFEELFE